MEKCGMFMKDSNSSQLIQNYNAVSIKIPSYKKEMYLEMQGMKNCQESFKEKQSLDFLI